MNVRQGMGWNNCGRGKERGKYEYKKEMVGYEEDG